MAPLRDPDAVFGRLVARKYLALVGPAETLAGSGSRDYIESHDLVVRVNVGHLISPETIPDVGSRTDILFHSLWFGPPGERERFIASIGPDVAWICGAYPRLDLDHPHARDAATFLAALGEDRRFRTVRLDRYLTLFRRVLTRPSTALSTINDLLSFDIAGLYVTGFVFGPDRPAPGRHIEEEEVPVDFDLESQRAYLARIATVDPRITVDTVIADELEMPADA